MVNAPLYKDRYVLLHCPHCLCAFMYQPWRPETGVYCTTRCQQHAYEQYNHGLAHPLDPCITMTPTSRCGYVQEK